MRRATAELDDVFKAGDGSGTQALGILGGVAQTISELVLDVRTPTIHALADSNGAGLQIARRDRGQFFGKIQDAHRLHAVGDAAVAKRTPAIETPAVGRARITDGAGMVGSEAEMDRRLWKRHRFRTTKGSEYPGALPAVASADGAPTEHLASGIQGAHAVKAGRDVDDS